MPRPDHFLTALLRRDAGSARLCIAGTNAELATTVETAFDSATRKRGLLGRDGLPPATALIIAPCSAVHTFRMRFPIDVIFAARDGRVLKIRHAVPASRVTGALRAFATIEMAAGAAARAGLRVGQTLRVSTGIDG